MPIYDFRCKEGHMFEHRAKVDHRHDTVECPECGTEAGLVIVGSPMLDPRMGVSKDFPTMAKKWDRKQHLRATGRMKDSNTTRFGTNVDVERDAHNLRKRYEQ